MAAYPMETNLTIGNTGETSPAQLDPFRAVLSALSLDDPSAGSPIDVDALTNSGYNNQELIDHLVDGTMNFVYASANRIPTEGDEFMWAHLFGLEPHELASWWYTGSPGLGALVGEGGADSGEAIYAAQIAAQPTEDRAGGVAGTHDYSNVIVFPMGCLRGESAGWFKEAVTMKKLRDGLYSDKTTKIKIRLADEAPKAWDIAFPNCETPGSIAGVSFLSAVQSGEYTAGEFASPIVDASQVNGLFPAYPSGAGGVIEAGMKHYYMGCWHTPTRGRCLYVRKDWFDGLSAAQQQMITSAAKDAHLQNMANQMANQDVIIEQFQALGAQVHRSLPTDVLLALREAVDAVYTNDNGLTGPGALEYAQIRDHQREFIKRNRISWESATVDRRARFNGRPNYDATLQPNS